ncbi:CU044_2847 family protein [Nonomuraea sp. NPDC051191]|uniref:CU044_2847 family protein n=1 Tax=Nonomuraea sp. NPDC051191 TaxID=3364372 RepID=UPI0037A8D84A
MASSNPDETITIRTRDGVKYQVYAPGQIRRFGVDREIIVDDEDLTVALLKVSRSLRRAVSATSESRADGMKVEFGMAFTPEGALQITQGRDSSHFFITLEYAARDVPREVGDL